jgi:hypothetical protein
VAAFHKEFRGGGASVSRTRGRGGSPQPC